MTTRFVVLGSDEEDEGGDLLYGHGHEQVNGGCTVSAEFERNIRLATPPQSTAAARYDLRMTALEATMNTQSPESNTPQSAMQDAIKQDSPASSEKRYSIPASLTSQVIRQELASAHAALLADCSNASPATPSARHDATSHSGPSSDYAVVFEDQTDMYREGGAPDLSAEVHLSLENEHTVSNIPARKDDLADHPSNLPCWVQDTRKGKATPQRGLTTYGRLEEGRKAKELGISEEVEKDIWEFNLLSQDPGMTKASALKGNAKKSSSILKSSRAKRQDPVGDDDREAHGISDKEGEEDWGGKEGRKGCKKVVPRKLITGRRSKTSVATPINDGIVGFEPIVYGDDENDDDYSPTRNSRKAKQKVTIAPPISGGRKKTRSNTDDWELMPALPKGRKSTVLKQLAAGFEFDRDSMTRKAAVKTGTSTSASASPLRNNPPLSPFKVDLARDSLILLEEEKEKYHAFPPTATSLSRVGLLSESSKEPSAIKLPQLSSGPEEMIESIAVGTGIYMSSTIPDKEHFDKAGKETSTRDVKESESIPLCSVTPRTGKRKSKLGNRSKTLAEMLDVETDKDGEKGGQDIVNMDVSKDSSFQSPTRKRVRLKQTRGKTVLAPSPEKKESESNNDITMSTSPVGLKEPKKPGVVAASDDDSPLSELDEVITPRQETNILPEISDSLKSKRLVPKVSSRKKLGRNTSKIISLDEDSTHEEDPPAPKSEIQFKSKKPPVKCQKKSQADTTDANEQSSQPPTPIRSDTASDEERGKKADSFLPMTTMKRKAFRTSRVESQYGKRNKKMKNSKGSTKQLDGQELRTKEGVGDSEPNEPNTGGPSHSQISTPQEQSIDTGEDKPPPSTPMLREPVLTLTQPGTPAKPVIRQNPHSPINGGKPPPVKFRVGLSRRANIEPLHRYLKK